MGPGSHHMKTLNALHSQAVNKEGAFASHASLERTSDGWIQMGLALPITRITLPQCTPPEICTDD